MLVALKLQTLPPFSQRFNQVASFNFKSRTAVLGPSPFDKIDDLIPRNSEGVF